MTDYRFEQLAGKTLAAITVADDKETITFDTAEGESYRLYHSQDCCESVEVEDISGDLSDLVGSPLLQAEEASNSGEGADPLRPGVCAESYTWTFYKLATIKGSVTIRWLGESNGYYSEGVDFTKD